MFEIEHRGILSKESYEALSKRLAKEATILGADDKEVAYYIFPDKLLKVVRNISKSTTMLSLKLNTLGSGSLFEEFEVPFHEDSFNTLRNICDHVCAPEQVIIGTQKRTNYEYEGVEIALKWSEDWEYHVELEITVEEESEKETADSRIHKVADFFSIPLMTEEEVAEFSTKVRSRRRKIRA